MYVGMLEWGGFFQHGKITFVECMVVGLRIPLIAHPSLKKKEI
jgi:hypothetical protein